LRDLKYSLDERNESAIDEINSLHKDIVGLNKLRKQIRALLYDLKYNLEQDDNNARRILNYLANESKLDRDQTVAKSIVINPENEYHINNGNMFTVSLLDLVGDGIDNEMDDDNNDVNREQYREDEVRQLMAQNGLNDDNELEMLYKEGRNTNNSNNDDLGLGEHPVFRSTVLEWLNRLEVKKNALVATIAEALSLKDSNCLHVLSAEDRAEVISKYEQNADQSSQTRWNQKTAEEMRAAMAAFETRSVFRDLQEKASIVQLSLAESTSKQAPYSGPVGQTIIVPPEDLTDEDNLLHFQKTLYAASKMGAVNTFKQNTILFNEITNSNNDNNDKNKNKEILNISVTRFNEWLSYKRIGIQTVNILSSLYFYD
jgi:hypothetical protein